MEKTTYANPEVRNCWRRNTLPVRVDQDATGSVEPLWRLGWPGDDRFGPDGTEIAKIAATSSRTDAGAAQGHHRRSLAGTFGREAFEVKPSAWRFLTKEQRAELTKNFDESYDDSWPHGATARNISTRQHGTYHHPRRSLAIPTRSQRARQTLDAAIALIDPVWGGVFQYSEPRLLVTILISKRSCRSRRSICGNTARLTRCGDPKYLGAARESSSIC